MSRESSRTVLLLVAAAASLMLPVARAESAVDPPSVEASRARRVIQATYRRPSFPFTSYTHATRLHWPGRYRVVEGSLRRVRTVEGLTLRNGGREALVRARYHESVSAVDPDTERTVRFEAIDVQEDRWVRDKNGRWTPKNGRQIRSTYLIDGKEPRPDGREPLPSA